MAANRRKTVEQIVGVTAGPGTSVAAASENAASSDAVLYLIALTSISAGSITFSIQIKEPTDSTWHTLTAGEMLGDTGAITAAGNYHISTRAPFGVAVRLRYVVVTGNVDFNVTLIFERGGKVF